MSRGFGPTLIRPIAVAIGALLVVLGIIITIGTVLLHFHTPGAEGESVDLLREEVMRPELWIAIALALLVLLVGALLARTPAHKSAFDRNRVIGSSDFWAEGASPVVHAKRRGPLGSLQDIKSGDTLYAQNGALAKVLGVLPGEDEYGKRRRGFIYASGLHGANPEMWIPIEAVIGVYPETRSVFLAAKGDEIEHFGWNLPPASFRRGQVIHQAPKSF